MKIILALVLILLSLSFARKPASAHFNDGRIVINLNHRVGDQLLVLDSVTYKNSLGQDFKISRFKYYIGQVILKKSNGIEFSNQDYFLVNEEEPSSKHLVLENIPAGNYAAIEFIIGVDSLDNCSGAQSGALDPVNAMFWAWNTGYIFLKLEGSSPFSKSPAHLLEYHVGGYKRPHNCTRKVRLNLDHNTTAQGGQNINIDVDILELLKNPTSINFEKLSSVTDFHNATLMADNYMDMFSISKHGEKN